jgi:hypothetical protein
MEKQANCAVCGKAAASWCAKCKAVYYCGRDHQKDDWFEGGHRERCGKGVATEK